MDVDQDRRRALDASDRVQNKDELRHTALELDENIIRLLVLQPSEDFDSVISCQVLQANLDDFPSYDALSYVWGDPASVDGNYILLDDQRVNVTANLASALRHLRYERESRIIWVDALCINQNNLDEKRSQIAQMGNIYGFCMSDIVWMGEGNKRISRAINVVKRLERLKVYGPKAFYESATLMQRLFAPKVAYDRETDTYEVQVSQKDMASLELFFTDSEVWRRIWIVQEVALAPLVVLQYGHSLLDWDVVARLLDHDFYPDAFHGVFLHTLGRIPVTKIQLNFENPQTWEHQRQATIGEAPAGRNGLLDVLARYRFKCATDPRDKVYSLLGLATDTLGIEADYRKSVKDLYVDVVKAQINASHNLDILAQSRWEFGNIPERQPDLPSWVPDFDHPGNPYLLFAQRGIFGAGKPSCEADCMVVDQNDLHLDGIDLGEIAPLKGSTPQDLSRISDVQTRTWIQEVLQWLPSDIAHENQQDVPPRYLEQEDAFTAFLRTLTVDCYRGDDGTLSRLGPEGIVQVSAAFTKWRAAKYVFGSRPNEAAQRMYYEIAQHLRFATTEEGLFSMIPLRASEGCRLAVLHGAKVPLVLRPRTRKGNAEETFELIGPAYVHGFMDGQAMNWAEEGRLLSRTFILQ